ncbi:MAG: SurA N-terminal domain-containing protein [Gammaproteobacteria bacterium]|nr:SurA N-terminal domain-containing protein [Gammaproteobacteria bacterium]
MLQAIRDRLVGWVAWGILILISVPFIFMGVTDFGSSAKDIVVAEVDGETISQRDYQRRYQSRRQAMQRQLGANYRPDLFDKEVQKNVIETMIEEKLLAMMADENKLHVGDQELSSVIRSDQAFQQDGKFDYDLYKSRLGQSGFTPESYETFLRNERAISVIPRMVRQSSFVTPEETQRYSALADQRRDIDYVLIGQDNISEEVVLQDEEVRAYYDNNPHEFIRPEQVKFEYVQLSAAMLEDRVEATDENIRRYYDENADSYAVEGQRKASHILLATEEGKSLEDSPEVLGKMAEIQEKLKSGEKFEDLARQYSDDPGSAQQGGDLGQVQRGVMVPPFEEALFALKEKGQISEFVRTSFGFHLIRLDDITTRQMKSFDDVKEEITAGFVKKQAVDLFYDQSERMAEISYENPDNLTPVADALGLQVQKSDWVSANNSATGIEGNQDVLRAVFSDRLKTAMTNSDPIETAVNEAVIVRVADARPESQIPFEEVMDQARTATRNAVMKQKISEYASSLLSRHQAGETLQQLADQEKLTVETADGLSRQDNGLPLELSRGVFGISASKDGKPRTVSIPLDDGQVALVTLRKITLPDTQPEVAVINALKNRDAARDSQMLLTGLRKKAQVVIYKDKL